MSGKSVFRSRIFHHDIEIENQMEAYQSIRRGFCLPRMLIHHIERELKDLDEYPILGKETDDKPIGFNILLHVYDRVLDPLIYRIKPKYFFTPYTVTPHTFPGGLVAGLLIGGGEVSLLTLSMMGLATFAWPVLVTFVCLPSLAYLIQGVKCFGRAICALMRSGTESIEAKQHFQRGIGCFLSALLLPLIFSIAFPIELVRFLTRSIMTVIDVAKLYLMNDILQDTMRDVAATIVFT